MSYLRIETSNIVDTALATCQKLGFRVEMSQAAPGSTKGTHWVRLRFPDARKLVNGDAVMPQLYLRNSYGGQCALQIHVGLFRLVCSNGLILGDSVYSDKVRHIDGPKAREFLGDLERRLVTAIMYIHSDTFGLAIEQATSAPIRSDAEAETYLMSLGLSQSQLDTIWYRWKRKRRPEDTDTVWGLYNSINESLARMSRSANRNAEINRTLLSKLLTVRDELQIAA